MIGELFWRIKPDFAVKKGLEVAFAPGFDVPDAFVEDVDRMTYSAYDDSPTAFDDYTKEEPLDRRVRETGKPLLVMMGAEEQIISDPAKRLAEYRATVPGTETELIAGAGHSPNVEKPARTAALVLAFANAPSQGVGSSGRGGAVSHDGAKRLRQHRPQAQPGSGAGPRKRASGVGGTASQQ